MRPGRECQSVVRADMRGRHGNRPNRTPVAALERVNEHIRSFPRYVSHYARDDNVHRAFLPSGLSVVKMYQLYSDKCVADGLEPVKESRYWQIFTEKFNLSFIQPRRDTCSRCDAFRRKVETQKKNGEDWEGTEADWTAHKTAADAAYKAMGTDKQQCTDKPDEVQVIFFDLEKALPTPKIATEDVYYRR